jgi:hypothetical protein
VATLKSLLVKIGLDDKKFQAGAKRVQKAFDGIVRNAEKLGSVGKAAALATLASSAIALTSALGPASAALLALPAAAAIAGAALATLSVGLAGMGDAMTALAEGDAAALDEALQKLAPSARSFVRSLAGIKAQFKPVQQAVQQRLFAGLGSEMETLAGAVLPTLRRGMVDVAGSLNGLAKEATRTMSTPLFQGQLEQVFSGTASATDSFRGVVGPLITVLTQLAIAGMPLITRFNEWASGSLGAAAAFLTSERGAAKLADVVTQAGDVMAQLGTIAGNLGMALGGIFGAAFTDGASLLDTIEQLTGQFAAWAQSAQGQEQLTQIFGLLNQVATDLLAILPGVASVIGTIAAVFTSLPGPVQSTVGQMLAWSMVLGAVSGKIGPLVGTVTKLGGGLVKLGQSIKSPDTALGKFARKLGTLAVSAGKGLGKLALMLGKLGIQALLMGARMLAGWLMGMGPIGWIIAAIIALVALVIIYWDEIVAAITIAWEWIKQATVAAWTAVVTWLTGIWNSIVSTATAAWEWLKAAVSAAWNWLVSLFMTYHPVGILMSHWEEIKAAAAAAWMWIKAKVSALWNGLVAFISNGIAKVKAFISNGFNAAKAIAIAAVLGMHSRVVATVARIISYVRGLPGRIRGIFSNAKSLLLNAGRNIIQGLIDGVSGMIGSLREKFSSVTNMIPNWKGPMRVDLHLLEPSGAALMSGLVDGIESGLPGLRGMLQGVTDGIPAHISSSAAVRHTGGGQTITLDVTGGTDDLVHVIRKWVRNSGRGDVNSLGRNR